MSATASTEIAALLKKLNVELPLVKQRLDGEITDLLKRHAEIEAEELEIRTKISQLRQTNEVLQTTGPAVTVFNLPHVAWRKMVEQGNGMDQALFYACLSSPKLEQVVLQQCPSTKLKLTGEKVFSILVLNYYLTEKDLQNCLSTNCPDLRRFAGSNYWCFEKIYFPNKECITLTNSAEIKTFHEKAEKEENKWNLFKKKAIFFQSSDIPAKSDYESFMNAAITFLSKFGKCIVSLSFCDNFPGHLMQNFCTDLFSTLPRLKFLCCRNETDRTWIEHEVDKRTLETNFIVRDYSVIRGAAWFQSLRHRVAGWTISNERLQDAMAPETKIWQGAKGVILNIAAEIFVPNGHRIFRNADFSRFEMVRKLTIDGFTQHFRSIALLEKFPNVDELTMHGGARSTVPDPNERRSFPRIKKLTWRVNSMSPLPLDGVPELFPSLRYLYLKIKSYPHLPLVDAMTINYDDGFFNDHVIDIYRLYVENCPLRDSNIWNEIQNLKVLCVISNKVYEGVHNVGEEEDQPGFEFNKKEIYTRDEETGKIRFDEVNSSL